MATGRSNWALESAALLVKDLRSELRSRAALNATLLFAVSALVMVSYTIGPFGITGEGRPMLLAVLLWIIIFFSAMTGLSRSFVKEEEQGTAPLLRLAARPSAVFMGKLGFNVALLGIVMLITVPLFIGLMELEIRRPGEFLLVLLLSGFGLSLASTLIAVIIAKSAVRGALFAVLTIPVALPLILFAVGGTRACAAPGPPEELHAFLRMLVSYDGVVWVAGLLLFPFAWLE
jgi:heme exporter protein B